MISRARLIVFFLAVALLVVCGGVFSYFQFQELTQERVWAKHALEVTTEVENARHNLILFETAASVKLSQPSATSLQDATLAQIETNLTRLRALVSDSSHQQAQLDEIELRLGNVSALLQEKPKSGVNTPVQTTQQIAQVDDQLSVIGSKMWAISQYEQQYLSQKESAWQQKVRWAQTAALIALFLTIVVVLVLGLGFRRDFRTRMRAWNSPAGLASLEEQLQRAQKMESLGLLAGGIAHDYNNLLMVIASYTKLLGKRISPADPELAEYITTIQGAVDTASSVTRQLLAFSRKRSPGLETLDLNVVVSSFCRLLPGFIGTGIEMRVRQSSAPCLYRGDRGQMEQVIMNLVANAKDAMPHGGSLNIEIGELELEPQRGDVAAPGRYVQLSIRDTGIGMDERTKARIFEPFFTTKPKDKGTGLGLATVHTIVEQSKGFILVDSIPGKGTTVRVHIPAISKTADLEALQKFL